MWKNITAVTATLFLIGCAGSHEGVVEPQVLSHHAAPEMVLRSDWGWVALQDSIPEHEIEYITLHHGGEDFPPEKDPVQYLINLQAWCRSDKDWIDIPYHYMIDLQGRIYEARPIQYPGDTNTSYDPRGHALICVMGNYEHQILTETQLQTVVDLSAYLASIYHVAPDSIRGHKDYTETLCPGTDFYRYITDGTIQEQVRQQLQP